MLKTQKHSQENFMYMYIFISLYQYLENGPAGSQQISYPPWLWTSLALETPRKEKWKEEREREREGGGRKERGFMDEKVIEKGEDVLNYILRVSRLHFWLH